MDVNPSRAGGFPDLKKPDGRELSSLRGNNKQKGNAANSIPPTKIPEQYHIKQLSGTPPGDPDLKTEYEEKSKMWKTTIFPSLRPSGRQEVLLLDKWLNDMLAENLAKNQDPIESVKEAQTLYSSCFHEICRQVYVQCAERGKLMEKIWNRYLQLFEHILKIREREKFSQTQKLEQQKAVYQKLYKEKDEKFNKAYLQLAAEKEKITMSKDKLERAVLVLQDEYKKRVKREGTLKKALKKQQQQLDRLSSKPASSKNYENSLEADDDGTKRVRMNDANLESIISIPSISRDLFDTGDEDMPKIASGLSLNSVDSFSRDEEEEEEDEKVELFNSEDIDFSNSNLILINKLEFITKSLRSIHKILATNPHGEDTYTITQQLGSVLEATADAINRMEHPELAQEPKAPQFKALSSMNALKAPVEKAVQTMEIEVNETVPRSFAPFFAKSFKVPVIHLKDRRWVFSCISYVYAQKIQDDEECDARNLPHTPFPQHLYQMFLRLFGMRTWAEMHLLDFLASLRKYIQQHIRVKMFARFAGLAEELYSPYTTGDLDFFLFVLSQLQVQHTPLLDNSGVPIFRETKDGNRSIALRSAVALIPIVFPNIETTAKESLTRVIESCMHIDDYDGVTQVLDLDKYLEVLVEEFHLRCNLLADRFGRALEESVSAPLPDNLLLYDEFLLCVNTFNSSITENEILSLYREILEASTSLTSVDAQVVLQVAEKRGLFCWKSYTSKADATLTDEYLLRFMEAIWDATKLDVLEKVKRIQIENIGTRIALQLQDKVRALQGALTNGAARTAMSLYRQVLEQIFFSAKKQSRIVLGSALATSAPHTPQTPQTPGSPYSLY